MKKWISLLPSPSNAGFSTHVPSPSLFAGLRCSRLLITEALWLLLISGCSTSHKIESTHEIKPITININIRIQDELKQKFSKDDQVAQKISDAEAEKALESYLSQNTDSKKL